MTMRGGIDMANASKVMVIVGLTIFVVLFVCMVINHQSREINDLKHKLELSQAALQGYEASLDTLRETNIRLLKSLETWKQDNAKIQKQEQDAKNELAKLEMQNETVAKFLRGNVPDDLWMQLFPEANIHNQN